MVNDKKEQFVLKLPQQNPILKVVLVFKQIVIKWLMIAMCIDHILYQLKCMAKRFCYNLFLRSGLFHGYYLVHH